jgi:hypothetical protein
MKILILKFVIYVMDVGHIFISFLKYKQGNIEHLKL